MSKSESKSLRNIDFDKKFRNFDENSKESLIYL